MIGAHAQPPTRAVGQRLGTPSNPSVEDRVGAFHVLVGQSRHGVAPPAGSGADQDRAVVSGRPGGGFRTVAIGSTGFTRARASRDYRQCVGQILLLNRHHRVVR